MNRLNALEGALARWLARRFAGDDLKIQRSLLLVYSTFAVVAFCTAFFPYYHYHDLYYGRYSCYLGLAQATVEFILLLVFRRVVLAGHFYCFSVLVFFTFSIYHTGGIASPFMSWLVVAPIMALFMFDRQAALLWGMIALSIFAAFAWLPAHLLGNTAPYTGYTDEISIFAGATFFCFVLVLIFFTERARFDFQRLQRLILADKRQQRTGVLQIMQGRELERQRISRELHDGVNTQLTALHLQYQAHGKAPTQTQPTELLQALDGLSNAVGQLSRHLSVHVLRDFGLEESIHHLVDTVSERDGQAIDLYFDPKVVLPAQFHLPVYRIVQEALELSSGALRCPIIELQVLGFPGLLRLMVDAEGASAPLPPQPKIDDFPETRDYLTALPGEILLEPNPAGGFSLIIELQIEHEKDQTDARR
ncbi:MAG: histidine kinase [Bacteroidota bacterium]